MYKDVLLHYNFSICARKCNTGRTNLCLQISMGFFQAITLFYPIPFHSSSVMRCHAMPCHAISFHSTSIPFQAMPWHTISFHFHSIPCHPIPFHPILFHPVPFHVIPYHPIPFHCTLWFYSIHEPARNEIVLARTPCPRISSFSG